MAGCGTGTNYQQEFRSIDANHDGFISQQEYAAARQGGGGGGGNNGGGGGGDCEDCVQVVKTTKKVRVPCHRNTYKQYTVKVPRQVTEQVPRTVNYTEMENRSKCVPYTEMKCEQRIRLDTQKYKVPVQKCVTKMVSVTRKVPKTIYVDVTTQVPKQETVTTMEDRTKLVKIPYSVQVPVQKFRTVNYQEPVQKQKTIMEKRCRTVFDTQVRTRCEPKVTYVTKEIPVYNVVARPAAPCPPDAPCGQQGGGGQGFNAGGGANYAAEFRSIDANRDGGISLAEYSNARTGFAAPAGGAAAGGGAVGGGAAAGGSWQVGGGAAAGGAAHGGAVGGGAAAGGSWQAGGAAAGGGQGFHGGASGGGGQGFNAGGGANYGAEFRSLDTNRDGKMSLAEYTAARTGGAPQTRPAAGGCAPCGN